MQLGGLLGTVFIVQEIDPIFMMTEGGPGNATTTLPYLVYRKAIEGSNVGRGAALGVIVVLMSIVVITLLMRLPRPHAARTSRSAPSPWRLCPARRPKGAGAVARKRPRRSGPSPPGSWG